MLNDNQIKEFKNNGFVLVPELFNKSETELIVKYTEEIQNASEISGKEWKYFEKSKINKDKRVLERTFKMKSRKIWGSTELIHANGVVEFHRIDFKKGTARLLFQLNQITRGIKRSTIIATVIVGQ